MKVWKMLNILSTIDEIFQSIMSPTLEEKQCGGTATFGNSDDAGLKVDGIEWASATERVVVVSLPVAIK